MYILGLANCSYLFSDSKYKAQYVLGACPIAVKENLSCKSLAGSRHPFFHIKNKSQRIFETWLVTVPFFLTQNMRRGMYLKLV